LICQRKKHDICIYDKENEKYISSQISNSRDGLEKLVSKIFGVDILKKDIEKI